VAARLKRAGVRGAAFTGPISVTPATPDAIRAALAAAATTRNYESRELRDAVSQFAADLHAGGVPPERVLIIVKQLADDSSLTGVSDWWRSIVTDRLVRWAVEGYYRIDLGGPSKDEGSA
jgi:hypothetical protein